MSPRKYRSSLRAASREQTHARIVKATAELHRERGVLDTTHAMIAARADVSVPTVYNHFPTRGDLVKACGAHIRAGAPPLEAPEAEPERSMAARVRGLVHRVFDHHAYYAPWSVRILPEAPRVPELAHSVALRRARVRELLLGLFGRTPRLEDLALAEVLLDFTTFQQLVIDRGVKRQRAERVVVDALLPLVERAPRKETT